MASSILIIPDIHQDYRFFARCLEAGQARPEVGEILLLGDLLDPKDAVFATFDAALQTIDLLAVVLKASKLPVTLLWGNHDWNYWLHRDLIHANPSSLERSVAMRFMERGLSLTTARALIGEDPDYPNIPPQALRLWHAHARLSVERHGYVISHAGFMPEYWPNCSPVGACIEELNTCFAQAAERARPGSDIPLTAAGLTRGGDRPAGGPLWLDWDFEFEDRLPLPQIVGHTRGEGARQKGRSYCLDACQSIAAVLHPDGRVEILDLSTPDTE